MHLANPAHAKKIIRTYCLARRKSEPRSKIVSQSEKITRRFLSSSYYKRSKNIACYLSFGSEVQTQKIIQKIWKDKKILLIPDTRFGFKKSRFVRYEKRDRLHITRFGMEELNENKKAFNFSKIDLVLVPGLAFDSLGYRLGFGSGVYDRLLKKASRAKHIGLFYSFQKLHRLPSNSWDRSLHGAVTDS